MRCALVVIAALGIGAGALAGANTAPDVRLLQVHPGLLPLEVRILPESASADARNQPHRIGRVEISRRGESKPFQTFEVTGYDPERLRSFSRSEDANFDGYADLLLCHDGGAKWGGYEIYFYDPKSGFFIQNELSRDMSEHLTGNSLDFHRATGEIELTHLPVGCLNGFVASETFVIQGSHLRKTGETVHLRAKEGCYAVTRRTRDGGGMEEVSRERMPELDRTD
ncbi:MAG TPA: hypothetical protein VLX28_04760 [Thermoanaerobaculia bacterium]|nr:hypothetical protein [Thermoanaerobaculia bacterium]